MEAGRTKLKVGQRVEFKDDGNTLTGTVTHPFAFGCTDKNYVGIYLDQEGIYQDNKMNMPVNRLKLI